MFRILQRLSGVILGLLAWNHALAFTTFGPLEGWQTITLDYGTRYYYGNDIELGGTKNFDEGSRLNVPIITYAYDYTFLSYFGAEGVKAVDAAMNAMNAMPAANKIKLSKFLTQGNQAINYTAQALSLTDIKSTVMSLMIEHEGLLGETHTWDLLYRDPTPVTCEYGYGVINRNYDPVTHNATPYVNGVQVGYSIWDGCSNGVTVADAIEEMVDLTSPAQYVFSAVATRYGQQLGGYYLGFTRDDVGGISFLYNPARIKWESFDTNSVAQYGGTTWSPVNPFATNGGASNGFSGILGGVNKITYVKVAYDSLIGEAFTPIQYSFTVPFVTNNRLSTLHVTRTISQPDILFTAGDFSQAEPFNVTPNNYPDPYQRTFTFISNNIVTIGPNAVVNSVISPQEIITFNDGGPTYFNENPGFLDSQQFIIYPNLIWGYFNGSTNAPIIFPNYSSIQALEAAVLTPASGSAIELGVYNPVNPFATNTTTTGGSGINGAPTF